MLMWVELPLVVVVIGPLLIVGTSEDHLDHQSGPCSPCVAQPLTFDARIRSLREKKTPGHGLVVAA